MQIGTRRPQLLPLRRGAHPAVDVVRRRRWVSVGMVLPCIVLILLLTIFPLLYSLGVSFFLWEVQIPGHPFVGLANYAELIHDATFWGSLQATAIIAGCAVLAELVLGMALALALAGKVRGKALVVPLLILPLTMMPIVVGETWRILWDPSYGPVDQILSVLSGRHVGLVWLSDPHLVFPAIIITDMWQWTPFVFLILLAGLSAINAELYEAAAMDGASAWKKLVYVTLPLLRPILLLAILFRLIDAIKIFDIVYALTQGGPGTETLTASYFVYQAGQQFFRYSYAAAASYVLLFFVTIIALVLIRRIRET